MPSVVQSQHNTAGAVAEVTATFASGPTAGNAVVVCCWGNAVGANPTCSDNQGNVYSRRVSAGTASNDFVAVFDCDSVTYHGGAFTVTLGTGGSTNFAVNVVLAEVSGMQTSGQPDVTAVSATGDTTSAKPGSITTATATDIVFAVMASNSGDNPASVTSPSGWTSLFKDTNGASDEVGEAVYQVESSTGTFDPTWTVPSQNWAACQVAYKGTGGGGAGQPPAAAAGRGRVRRWPRRT